MNTQSDENSEFNKEIQEALRAIRPTTIDASPETHPETKMASSATPPASTAKKRIMVVDDDETLRGIYTAVFRESGLDSVGAEDGQDAWDKMENGVIPDIIFTGLTMPRINGFELLQKIKAHPARSKIPVIIFSHRGRPEDRIEAEKLGAADFIININTTPADVVRRVRSIFGEHEKLRVKLSARNKEHAPLIDLLKKQQMTSCLPDMNGEYTAEIETTSERGKFSLRIIC
jgi:DNA-binding response OmpR family regulator